ncbi:ferredoxin reductase [Nocardia sp. 348MFTsu5.1]|uniref:ferredoxin reductase n=1 Tax=Nocardia sp. 348MFTsu5.1 TaxID=1172185 RepID=UPI000364B682|nr:ferredoxin reductase [Nocardia sp. 348MFTsu5.1]
MARTISKILGSVVEAALTPHPVDRYLELVDPRITWTDLRAEVITVTHRSDRSVTLLLRPTRQWTGFDAGQFVQLSTVINGVRHTRCYSPAGSATDREHIELTVTAHDDGFVSRHLRDNTRPGDVLGLTPAAGTFTMPTERPGRMIFISGGSGITPVLSMLRTLVAENYRGHVDFIHYARNTADHPYARELDSLAADHPEWNIDTHYTRLAGAASSSEHFRPDHLPGATMPSTPVFLCGPSALHSSVREHLTEIGALDNLHTEQFVLIPPAADDDAPAHGQLTFAASGTDAPNNGASILQQAESAGLQPEFGCRMGICFSCTAIKRSGLTKNILTGDTDAESDQHIQLCISKPVGDCVIDI